MYSFLSFRSSQSPSLNMKVPSCSTSWQPTRKDVLTSDLLLRLSLNLISVSLAYWRHFSILSLVSYQFFCTLFMFFWVCCTVVWILRDLPLVRCWFYILACTFVIFFRPGRPLYSVVFAFFCIVLLPGAKSCALHHWLVRPLAQLLLRGSYSLICRLTVWWITLLLSRVLCNSPTVVYFEVYLFFCAQKKQLGRTSCEAVRPPVHLCWNGQLGRTSCEAVRPPVHLCWNGVFQTLN